MTQFENLLAIFSKSPIESAGWPDGGARKILEVPGVLGGTAYEAPAFPNRRGLVDFGHVALFELGPDLGETRKPLSEVVAALVDGDGNFVTYLGVGQRGPSEVALPDHLYLVFSSDPDVMTFSEYSDWYEEHQAENIAVTPTLTRGWRFELAPFDPSTPAGPTHLAAYEMNGTLAAMRVDLDAALASGVTSLPDWWHSFGAIEAVAEGRRVSAS